MLLKLLMLTAGLLGKTLRALRNIRPDDLRAILKGIETWKPLVEALILQIALVIFGIAGVGLVAWILINVALGHFVVKGGI